MERYSDSSLNCWPTNSSEWTTIIREETLEPTEAIASSSSTAGKGLALVSSSVIAMLLIFSLFTVTWGTVKLSQSVAQLTQIAAQGAMHSNP
ncbi:MAG: hypothetical protein SFY66_21390 [Oculatellaceae cyanobacterium bins.114]|nr:hypothetical protein [Oculatellaceae cyanobacterium bins.114]